MAVSLFLGDPLAEHPAGVFIQAVAHICQFVLHHLLQLTDIMGHESQRPDVHDITEDCFDHLQGDPGQIGDPEDINHVLRVVLQTFQKIPEFRRVDPVDPFGNIQRDNDIAGQGQGGRKGLQDIFRLILSQNVLGGAGAHGLLHGRRKRHLPLHDPDSFKKPFFFQESGEQVQGKRQHFTGLTGDQIAPADKDLAGLAPQQTGRHPMNLLAKADKFLRAVDLADLIHDRSRLLVLPVGPVRNRGKIHHFGRRFRTDLIFSDQGLDRLLSRLLQQLLLFQTDHQGKSLLAQNADALQG